MSEVKHRWTLQFIKNHESITDALIEAGATTGPEADDWSDDDEDE
jgi:hypothetical protein